MGNEQSSGNELTKIEKVPETHENGSANGHSVTITSNGLEVDLNGEAVVEKNGVPPSLNLATEVTETSCDITETVPEPTDAPVTSETPEPVVQEVEVEVKKTKGEKGHRFGKLFKKKAPKAEAKTVEKEEKSGEDQTDVSLPATDPPPESGCSGVEATAVIIAEHKEDSVYAQYHRAGTVSTSTQTERITQADTSTQTGDHDEEEAGIKISASEEDSLYASADVIPEDVVDNQAAGIILEEVFPLENGVFENTVFRAERVEGGGRPEINTALDETEPQHDESPLNESALESETFAESNIHELYSDLPEVVADCVRAVFAAVTEFPHFAAIAPLEPHGEEVITEDKNEAAEDMSADRTLIKTTGPESNAVTPEDGEVNSAPLQVYVPVMENTEKAAGAELDPTRANQDELTEKLSFYDATHQRGLIEMDAAHEEVTAVDALAFQGTPEVSIVGRVPNELFIFWGLPEDVMATFRLEAVQEAEPSPVTVRNPAAETLQAAMEALSQELSAIVSLEPEMESDDPVREEVIVPTTSEPLSGEQDANLSGEPCGIDFDKVNEDSKETFMLTMDLAGSPNLSDEPIASEEHPKNDAGSDDVEPTAEFIANIIGADVNTEVTVLQFITNTGPETCEEAEASPAIVKSNAEEATNPVTEGPSQDLGAIVSSGHEEDDVMQLDEEEDAPTFDSF